MKSTGIPYIKIGIDTDDVIIEYNNFMKNKGAKYFKKNVVNHEGYDLSEIFEVTKKQRNNFWAKYISKYIFQKVNPKVKNRLDDFVEKGYEINNITARVYAAKKGIIGTVFRNSHNLAWVLNRLPLNGKRYFCSEHNSDIEKAMICRLHGIDFMFEDRVHNIEKIIETSPNTIVFCVNQAHNKSHNFNNERVIRVNGIYDEKAIKIIDAKYNYYKTNLKNFVNEDNSLVKKRKGKIALLPNDLKIKIDYLYNNDFKQNSENVSFLKKIHQKFSYNLSYFSIAKMYEMAKKTIYLNKDNIPFNGGYLISFAPHVNHTDHLKTGSLVGKNSYDKQLHYLAATEFKSGTADGTNISKKSRKWALKIFDIGLIYVDRSSLKSKFNSYNLMKQKILEGKKVVICPEGTRGVGIRKDDSELLDFQGGICELAKDTKAPIIPVSHYKNVVISGEPIFIDDENNETINLEAIHKKLLETCMEEYAAHNLESKKDKILIKKV